MPVGSINSSKDNEQGYKPLLLCTFTFDDGSTYRCSTDPLNVAQGGYSYAGNDYEARILNQDIAVMQAMSDQGIDHPGQVQLEMADPDKYLYLTWDQAAGRGFKGAQLEIVLVTWNVGTTEFSTDSRKIFVGYCDSPKGTSTTLRVSAVSRLDLGKVFAPPVRIQKRCPWIFPRSAADRAAAANDPSSDSYECGYCPEQGVGTAGFTDCGYTKAECEARGMYQLGRFGGVQWAPPATFRNRSYTEQKTVEGSNTANEAKYNDYIPFIYGRGWVEPPIMSVLGGGDSTRFEAVLCVGEVDDIQHVIVNDVQLQQGSSMTHGAYIVGDPLLAWWLVNRGDRDGAPNMLPGFDGHGDPYGSIGAITGTVHKRIASSESAPRVRVLLSGPKIRTFTGNGDPGTMQGVPFNQNPVWQVVDLLIWGPCRYTDINLDKAAATAAKCDRLISYVDGNGNTVQRPRFSSSVVGRERTSIAQLVRGIRTANRLIIYQDNGLIQIDQEETLGDQQPAPIPGSNDTDPYPSIDAAGQSKSGYVAYHFDESSYRLKGSPGTSTFELVQTVIAETPNVINVSFQDADNEYFPDSITSRDTRDIQRAKREVDTQLVITGIQTYDQAKRIMASTFAKLNSGNPNGDSRGTLKFDFETTIKASHLHVGQLVSLSNEQWNLDKQLFRVDSITPTMNYDVARIRVSFHNDNWYKDDFGQIADPEISNPRRDRLPRPPWAWQPFEEQPAEGDSIYATSDFNFAIAQEYEEAADSGKIARVVMSGHLPVNEFSSTVQPPFARQANGSASGGTLSAGRAYWCCIAARDSVGKLSSPCPPIKAVLPPGTNGTGSFTVPNISWASGTAGYVLYAGSDPNRMSSLLAADGTPASLTVAALNVRTEGPPDVEYDHTAWKIKRVRHSGVAWATVASVTSNTITLSGVLFDPNEFNGRDISVLGVDSTDPVPIYNARIDSHTANVITLEAGSPPPSFLPGTLLVVRSKPTVGSDGTGNYLEDPLWENSQYPNGMTPGDEEGEELQFIGGTGYGFAQRIKANTSTRLYIHGDWTVTPDSTSRYIVTESDWQIITETSTVDNADVTARASWPIEVSNLKNKVLFVKAFAVDGGGAQSWENVNPFREIFIYGELGTNGGGGEVDVTPPGEVTINRVEPVYENGKVLTRLVYTPPIGDERFKGVHAFLEAPDRSGEIQYAEQGGITLDETPTAPSQGRLDMKRHAFIEPDTAGRVTITLDGIPPPSATAAGIETWRAFLASYSDLVELETNIEHSVTFEVRAIPIFGIGEEYAPAVRNLAAAVVTEWRGDRWQYQYSITWEDPTRESHPDRFNAFAALNLKLSGPNGAMKQHHVEAGAQRYDSGWLDLVEAEHWNVVALSEDKGKNINTESRFAITPRTYFDIPAKPILSDVQNFAVTVEYRDGVLVITPTWDEPVVDVAWSYIQFRVQLPNGDWVDLSHPAQSAEAKLLESQYWPSAEEEWEFRAVSVDKAGTPKWPVLTEPGTSPSAIVTIPAPPVVMPIDVPNVANFQILKSDGTPGIEFGYDAITGQPDIRLRPQFDKPESAAWTALALRIRIVETDGRIELQDRFAMPVSENPESVATVPNDYLPLPGTTQQWEIAGISVGTDGKLRFPDIANSGDSPTVTVAVSSPESVDGEEYCLNPSAVQCEIIYPVHPDGVAQWAFRFKVTPPEDPRYKGCKPIAVDTTNYKRPLANLGPADTGAVWFETGPFGYGADTTFTVWFPGMNAAGSTNGLEEGTTPNVKNLRPTPPAPTLDPQRLDPNKIDQRVIVTTDGKLSLKMADGSNIGIGANGLELNGVPLGKAREGTYDASVFSADPTNGFKQIAVDFSIPKAGSFDSDIFGLTGGKFSQLAVDFGKPKAGSYNTNVFDPSNAKFKVKLSGQFTTTANGIEVSQIDCDILKSGNILVGNKTGQPASVTVYRYFADAGSLPSPNPHGYTVGQNLVGWIGANATAGHTGIVGGWFKELYVGGSNPASAKLFVDSAGSAVFSGQIKASFINSTFMNIGNVNNEQPGAPTGVYCYYWNQALNGGNGANDLVAWMGAVGGIRPGKQTAETIYGGWFKELYVGGTSPSNAKVYVDETGNAWFSGSITSSALTSSNIYGNTFWGNTINVGHYNSAAATGVYAYRWFGDGAPLPAPNPHGFTLGQNLIGWIGSNGSYFGGWMREFYIGGTGPENAKVYVDSAGSAVFSGALNAAVITGGGLTMSVANKGVVSIHPAVYDASYTSVGVNVTNGNDYSWLVSRGIVIHNANGQGPDTTKKQVAALVRSPTDDRAGELVLYGNQYATTGNYIYANGADGTVRADNGFRVRSYMGYGGGGVGMPSVVTFLRAGGTATLTIIGGLIVDVSFA